MDPCKVCGGTDLNLVDGFYYCVECGTQDVNVQETVVEQTAIGDGTFALATGRKFTTAVQDEVEMSGEWHKWHIFNFILAGLTDELIALGAKPSLKMKVLWVWTKYVKMFQLKDEVISKSKLDINDKNDDDDDEDETKSRSDDDKEDSRNDDSDEEPNCKSKKCKTERYVKDVKIITRGTLLTILYVALNLDRSDIQISHLLRFIKEDRLSLYRFGKFVPKELNTKLIKNWRNFLQSSSKIPSPISIRDWAMTLFKRLKLGVPCVPDLQKLVCNYIQNLCLPGDFNKLVLALMHYVPIDFLDVDSETQKSLVRIPDYEGACMAYILVALKMCFGLDDDYEVRLSQEVDKINEEENYLKSYKFIMFSEPTDRLFSFKDWCEHLQFRKLMLSKYYLPMAKQYNTIPDDNVFMEHLEPRRKREVKLSDDVTMDILNKIKGDDESEVIPKDKFPVTFTPMTCYVDVIAQYIENPDIKLLLCEDFTKYSLQYAIQDLTLPSFDRENLIIGVSETGKVLNDFIIGTLKVNKGDNTLVYVRNCQNKNWLKTKPPTVDHVKISQNESSCDKESDYGYDSNAESSFPESDGTHITVNNESFCLYDKKVDIIEEIEGDKNIFDDNFTHVPVLPPSDSHVTIKEEEPDNNFEINTPSNIGIQDGGSAFENHESYEDSDISVQFNPNAFNRDKMIKELIELARKKYRIPAPKDNVVREPRKRKVILVNDEASSSEPKKKRSENRAKPGQVKVEINRLISTYYNNLQNDILNRVAEQIKSLVENTENIEEMDTQKAVDDQNNLNTSNVTDAQNALNNSIYTSFLEENEHTQSEINANQEINLTSTNQEDGNAINSDKPSHEIEDSVIEEVEDVFPKSDPNFDEKDHDIKQLYVKLCEGDTNDVSLDDLEDDPKIDKIIHEHMEKFSYTDKCVLDKENIDNVNDLTNDFKGSEDDDEDNLVLSKIKEMCCIEQEKLKRRKQKLEPLIRNPSNVKQFQYWIRHYKSRSVIRSRDMNKKFDVELSENLPTSFVLVIRECAALLGCSMFSLYKYMQTIEELLIRP